MSHDHAHDHANEAGEPAWKHDGVRVIAAQPARRQHRADARHGPRGRHQLRARRCAEAVGRHGHHPRQRQDRRPSPRPPGKRDLRGQGPGPHALGRAPRIHRRSRAGRLHLRAALRAAPGNQRQRRPRRSSACCAAATARQWRSTSTSSRSRSPRRCCGSTRRIRTAASESVAQATEARGSVTKDALSRKR